jgi:hypothetical protein
MSYHFIVSYGLTHDEMRSLCVVLNSLKTNLVKEAAKAEGKEEAKEVSFVALDGTFCNCFLIAITYNRRKRGR